MTQLSPRSATHGRYILPPLQSHPRKQISGYRPGLGDEASTMRTIGQAGTLANAAAPAAIAAIYGAGGTVLGMTMAVALPVVGAALAGVMFAIQTLAKGCGQTCIVASNWANQAEDALRKNIEGYFALPAPRTQAQQAIALANFKTIWDALVNACRNNQLGDAGVRCVEDRQQGACKWHQTADRVPPWGTPRDGECWNWWNGYRDPIANDAVVPDPVAAAGVTGTVAGAFSSVLGTQISSGTVLLAAGAFLLLAGVMGGGK